MDQSGAGVGGVARVEDVGRHQDQRHQPAQGQQQARRRPGVRREEQFAVSSDEKK